MKKITIFIFCTLLQINYSHGINAQDLSYADIVEPLIPSVVNVYTSQNTNKYKAKVACQRIHLKFT